MAGKIFGRKARWRVAAGVVAALLLLGGIGLYQMGVPVWVPWTPRAEQPDPPRADKAKAAAEAEAQRKAEEAEQQRAAALRPEQAPSDAEKACDARAVDVNAKPLIGMARISFIRKCVSDAEAARSALLPQSAQQFAKAPFEIRTNVEAISPYARGPSPQSGTSAYWSSLESAMSTGECETICARSPACKIFSYSKNWQVCYMYSNATLAPNSNFDSGIRR